MKKRYLGLLISVLVGFMLLASGCSSPTVSNEGEPVELIVSAAASLTDAMEELKQAYAQVKPHVTLTYNFGGSGSLQQQIEQGAPADLFLSAAKKQMNELNDKGMILEDTIIDLLENKVVVVSALDTEGIHEFTDLTQDSITQIAIGEPESVPVGQYTVEILEYLEMTDQLQPKIIYGKDVREVLTWVETGNVQAGVVYATDAQVSAGKVNIGAAAPVGSHAPVIYPAAVVKSSNHQDDAKDFLEFLTTDEAKAVFEKYGFVMVE